MDFLIRDSCNLYDQRSNSKFLKIIRDKEKWSLTGDFVADNIGTVGES